MTFPGLGITRSYSLRVSVTVLWRKSDEVYDEFMNRYEKDPTVFGKPRYRSERFV